MTTNYVQPGEMIEWTNGTGADVVSSQVVVVGAMIGIAAVDIASGATGTVNTEGVYSVPKTAAAVITQGAPLMWDASAGEFTVVGTAATGDVTGAAVAWKAAGNGATTVHVKINVPVGTVAA